MENPVLIKWEADWADEIAVYGFTVMPQQKADSYKQYLKNREDSFTLYPYIGSYEGITYDNGQDLLEELQFSNLTDDEFEVFKKYFRGDDTCIYYGVPAPAFADMQLL